MAFAGDHVRIVLDEDLPDDLAEHLRARGINAVHINEIREQILARRTGVGSDSIADDEVCQETAAEPSVLVTLNIRDYADPAAIEAWVQEWDVSVAIVRVPKKESKAGERPAAIRDIVHRWIHRVTTLYGDTPAIGSLTRRGMRIRTVDEILQERQQALERAERRRHEAAEKKREREIVRGLRTKPRTRGSGDGGLLDL